MIFDKKKRNLILGGVGALLVLFVIKSLFFGTGQVTYLTTAAKKGTIEENVLATGIVKPHRLVAVGARATGRIVSLKVAAGDMVKEGDLLAEIDPITQQNDLKNKEAALANNRARLAEQQAQLVLAGQNLARKTTMLKNQAVSKADHDAAETEVKVREAQINALKAQITQSEVDVETARVNLGYTRVTAPFDGTVLATVVQEGQNVNAVQSAPTIVILGDLSKMTVRTQISEADIVQVKSGQDLWFNVIGNMNRRYNGRLEAIEPAPESIRNDISFNASAGTSSSASNAAIYYNGLFTIDNADGALRTYMTAEVHIVLGHAKDALLIPADSLGARDKQGLYTVRVLQDNGKIVEKQVKTGLNNKVMVQVLSGLEEGNKVITGERGGNGTPGNTGRRRGRVL
ncbi:MAG: Efflux transporter MFP subunit, RND family [Candidatus Tokpelaia hoelldobleri]|uniref:Efflux transporter MFP subunit, RND family n=1 Tax=Candidatus Tokpelaia hoelldobleri TaxID=1902579 RepID=A0A1U9JWF0_9HYPH|nr:MAG: Efflux transporter MFP subunit, RND family [Candidatus Tokpelaia hoelldoblerii]